MRRGTFWLYVALLLQALLKVQHPGCFARRVVRVMATALAGKAGHFLGFWCFCFSREGIGGRWPPLPVSRAMRLVENGQPNPSSFVDVRLSTSLCTVSYFSRLSATHTPPRPRSSQDELGQDYTERQSTLTPWWGGPATPLNTPAPGGAATGPLSYIRR